MSANDLASREERPAYVSFERVAVEDKAASLREGRFVAKDVDYVNVTPAYSKDCFRSKVSTWLETVDRDVVAGRTPERWAEAWKEAYRRWQNGQEAPLHGTPIRGWGAISPAQQEMLTRMNCLTVEDLAQANDEGLKRMGMGGMELRSKARAWMQSVTDHGGLTIKMASLETENLNLRTQIETLTSQVAGLVQQLPREATTFEEEQPGGIAAEDILPDPTPKPVRQLRPRVPTT